MTLDDLTVNFAHLDRETLLADWRWLIGPTKHPVLLAAIGDAYLQDSADGSIHLRDVGGGSVDQVADTGAEFKALLADPEFVGESFVPEVIQQLRSAGKTLAAGQIYSYKQPPVLGGDYSIANMEPTDISVHFGVLGQVHEQAKDLPPGTAVDSVTIE